MTAEIIAHDVVGRTPAGRDRLEQFDRRLDARAGGHEELQPSAVAVGSEIADSLMADSSFTCPAGSLGAPA